MLIEENRTYTDQDAFNDEDYFGVVVNNGPPIWMMAVIGFFVAVIGAILGFVCAMRRNPGFNRRVRSTALFQPLSQSSLVRSTCNLPDLQNYEEIKQVYDDEFANSHPSF